MDVHIGKLIKAELERQGRTARWLASQLNCDRTNVYNIFKRSNIDLLLLNKISVILNHNFFVEICADTANDITDGAENKQVIM